MVKFLPEESEENKEKQLVYPVFGRYVILIPAESFKRDTAELTCSVLTVLLNRQLVLSVPELDTFTQGESPEDKLRTTEHNDNRKTAFSTFLSCLNYVLTIY